MKRASKIILINPKKELLFYLRDNKPWLVYPGNWDFIGGGIKQNESPLEAIKREIKEEINCKVENIKSIGTIYIKELNEEVIIFKGDINIALKDINLTEGQDIQYFKLDSLHKIKTPCFYREFILKNKDKIFS